MFWLQDSICATTLAMILSISTAIGPIFDNVRAPADMALGHHRFLNHATIISPHLQANHYRLCENMFFQQTPARKGERLFVALAEKPLFLISRLTLDRIAAAYGTWYI